MRYKAVIFDRCGTLVDAFLSDESRRVISKMAAILSVAFDDFSRLWRETFNQSGTGVFVTMEANLEHLCQAQGTRVKDGEIAPTGPGTV